MTTEFAIHWGSFFGGAFAMLCLIFAVNGIYWWLQK